MDIHINVTEPWKDCHNDRCKREQQFSILEIEPNGMISKFREKSNSDGSILNGGYMILNP